jgi:hypothetical protein
MAASNFNGLPKEFQRKLPHINSGQFALSSKNMVARGYVRVLAVPG